MTKTEQQGGMELVTDPARAEAALWRRLRFEADQPCRETLFNRYLVLARSIAAALFHQRRTRRIERGDFDQFASEGLLQSLDRFDPLRGVPFAAFARQRIVGSISTGIATMSEVDAQLSHRARVERERVRALALQSADDPVEALSSLAVGLAIGLMLEGSGVTAGQRRIDPQPDPYESLAWRETQALLARAVDALPAPEETVVRQHYGNGIAFVNIAALLEVSAGRVSQLHRAALDRLRRRLKTKDGS